MNRETVIFPEIKLDEIKCGDMPGDKVEINEGHIEKAKKIFPKLLEQMKNIEADKKNNRIVVSVCGGSGVGKSEIASVLGYFLVHNNVKSYILSGDNYPHRIPKYNDAERLNVFRKSGIKRLVDKELASEEVFDILREFQSEDTDADKKKIEEFSWMNEYIEGGREGLCKYLGTPNEIDFSEVNQIITQFKNGNESIWLKRMGRSESDLWYSKEDFSDVEVLIVEWTHGNSRFIEGVDIPVLLNSTPEETLAHRRERNRDGATDSPFTTLVLEIEQGMIHRQAEYAKIIISKAGELLSYDEYLERMSGVI